MANKQIRISITSALNAAGIEATKAQVGSMAQALQKSMGDAAKSNRIHWADIKAAWDMGLGAFRKLAGGLRTAIAAAFKFETAIANFKTLTGSIDEARRHVADLRNFSASNPLAFDDVASASKTMLSFGISVKDIMPSLKVLGDISMGNSEKFKALALAFGQCKSAGRLMGQDLLQMINQGFNPLTVIAQETGRSMAELKDIMSEGGISFEMVEAAFRKATEEGGLFHDALKNASETGDGLMAKARDTWDESVRRVGEAFSDTAKNGLKEFTDGLSELNEDGTIENWAERSAESLNAFGRALAAVGGFFGKIWTGIKATVGTGMAFAAGADQAFAEGASFKEQIARGKEVALAFWNNEIEGEADEQMKQDREFKRKQKKEREEREKTAVEGQAETKKRTIREMLDQSEQEKAAKEAEKKANNELKAQMKAAEKAAAERARLDAQEAARRERQLQKEYADKIRNHQNLLNAEREAEAEMRNNVAAADAKLQQAWGWYRDKDSMAAQMAEEKANAAALKQFEKDFEKLKSRHRDWREAENLSVDDEAVRRVALAREEKQNAERHLSEIERNTAELAEKLEELLSMKGGE